MSLTSRVQSLLTYANNTTGIDDTTLSEAVRTLTGGYGSKYSGKNLILLDTYEETYDLSDTSFVIGETAPSTNLTIKSAVTNKYTYGTYNFGHKDVIAVQKMYIDVTHDASAQQKALQKNTFSQNIAWTSRCKNSPTNTSLTRRTTYINMPFMYFYNTAGTLSVGTTGTYGMGVTFQTPSFGSNTADTTTFRCSSPALNARYNSSYETRENMKLITDVQYKWVIELYVVDEMSMMYSDALQNAFDYFEQN